MSNCDKNHSHLASNLVFWVLAQTVFVSIIHFCQSERGKSSPTCLPDDNQQESESAMFQRDLAVKAVF